jgi:hypothetical protein
MADREYSYLVFKDQGRLALGLIVREAAPKVMRTKRTIGAGYLWLLQPSMKAGPLRSFRLSLCVSSGSGKWLKKRINALIPVACAPACGLERIGPRPALHI